MEFFKPGLIIDFMRHRRIYMAVSFTLVAASIVAVFFPGLLFGWLRARRGGIGAAIAVHALSNVLAELLVRGWL